MIQGVFFYTLKGINGLSSLSISRIDIAKVMSLAYRKRLFCIFDREYPFTLQITYNEPKTVTTASPVFGKHNGGVVLHRHTEQEQLITKRYMSEKDVVAEINEITKRQQLLETKIKELFKINE